MVLIDKLARVFASKYDLRQYGYTFDDIRSLVAEYYCVCLNKYKDSKGVKFETYVSRSVNNAIIDILRSESKRPLNNSSCLVDCEDGGAEKNISEWKNVRDILLKFEDRERLIVKELIDPSEHVVLAVRAILAKRKFAEEEGMNKRTQFHTDVLQAIRLVYGFTMYEFKFSMAKIRKKVSGKNFFY